MIKRPNRFADFSLSSRVRIWNTSALLDALPGGLAWLALTVCLLGVIFTPLPLLTVGAVLAFYSAVRFAVVIYANLIGFARIRQAERINWRSYYAAHRHKLAWSAVHHLVIIPNYGEPLDLLRQTLANIAQSAEAGQMTVVLAMEARDDGAESRAQALHAEFGGAFAGLWYTLHPDGIPGERRCKSANQNWAVRWAKRRLVDELGYDREHVVVTTMDADTLWHPSYFSALTAQFATDTDRYQRIWQAPIRYHANVHAINPLMRLANAYATAFELAFLAADWWLALPMSSYSLSLRLLEECDYWDVDVIADEWHSYIKAFGVTNGRILIQPIFLPFMAYATTGATIRESCLNRYRQSLRHGWGSKELGFAIATTSRTPKATPVDRARLVIRIAHDILLPGAGWIIVTLGTQLPILLHADIREMLLTNPLSSPSYILLQIGFGLFTLCGLGVWWLDVRSRPPRSTPLERGERLYVLLSFLMLPLMAFAFVALPLLQAQTRLMFRDDLTFSVTAKQISDT